MSIKTKHNPIGGVRYYTLTVVTTPSDAVCKLTYNGNTYTSKTATVKAGTTISYTITHSTYGTDTGSTTMYYSKKLTVTGVSTPITTEKTWSRPNLTANGTLGGSSCAIIADTEATTKVPAYYAVDSSTSTQWQSKSASSNTQRYLIFYTPTAIKLTKVVFATPKNTSAEGLTYSWQLKDCTVYGSNTNGSWVSLGSVSGVGKVANATVTLSNTNYYKYYKFLATKTNAYSPNVSYYRWACSNITMTAKYQNTTYSYSFSKSYTRT